MSDNLQSDSGSAWELEAGGTVRKKRPRRAKQQALSSMGQSRPEPSAEPDNLESIQQQLQEHINEASFMAERAADFESRAKSRTPSPDQNPVLDGQLHYKDSKYTEPPMAGNVRRDILSSQEQGEVDRALQSIVSNTHDQLREDLRLSDDEEEDSRIQGGKGKFEQTHTQIEQNMESTLVANQPSNGGNQLQLQIDRMFKALEAKDRQIECLLGRLEQDEQRRSKEASAWSDFAQRTTNHQVRKMEQLQQKYEQRSLQVAQNAFRKIDEIVADSKNITAKVEKTNEELRGVIGEFRKQANRTIASTIKQSAEIETLAGKLRNQWDKPQAANNATFQTRITRSVETMGRGVVEAIRQTNLSIKTIHERMEGAQWNEIPSRQGWASQPSASRHEEMDAEEDLLPVSYTHLTLPTIYSV